jgi:peptide/nickel transport system substrate-binding protein
MSEFEYKLKMALGAIGRGGRISRRDFMQLALAQARAETDDAKRAAMYAEMQQIQHDDNGNVILVFNNYVSAHSKKLGHGEIAPNWEKDGLKVAERWWFVQS